MKCVECIGELCTQTSHQQITFTRNGFNDFVDVSEARTIVDDVRGGVDSCSENAIHSLTRPFFG